MAAEIIQTIVSVITGFLSGIGTGIVTFFTSLFTDGEGALSTFAIWTFVVIGLAFVSSLVWAILKKF